MKEFRFVELCFSNGNQFLVCFCLRCLLGWACVCVSMCLCFNLNIERMNGIAGAGLIWLGSTVRVKGF